MQKSDIYSKLGHITCRLLGTKKIQKYKNLNKKKKITLSNIICYTLMAELQALSVLYTYNGPVWLAAGKAK